MPRKLTSLLLVLFLLGAGLYAAVWRGAGVIFEATEVADWPTVTGSVVSSFSQRSNAGSTRSHSWVVVVNYRYEVEGTQFHGDRWTVAGPRKASGEAHADELRSQFTADDPIEVRYDPANPSRSVLAEGGTASGWAHVGFGLLLLAVGGYVARTRLLRA